MPRKHSTSLATLPQPDETWGVATALLRLWITPPDEPPSRPHVVLVLDLKHGWVIGYDLTDAPPTTDFLQKIVFKAMTKPPKGCGRPRRPQEILFSDPDQAQALSSNLIELGITCQTHELPMIPDIVRELETSLRHGEPEHPGLLSVAGVTPQLAGGFFAATADFYSAAPWVQITNQQTFAIRFPAQGGQTRIGLVLGNGGAEYGLAVYNTWVEVERQFMGRGLAQTGLLEHGPFQMAVDGLSPKLETTHRQIE